ncbi:MULTISPECIES: exonuclease SbcCD subunit D [Brachybacterium]|uniref:Nuclease SbcCD subunit D n=2 Tax=Brachybacterium TaxID=43668 RepID=A0A3R8RY48_9MICO|nr:MULTISPECIES: exonuclease SbcCD subunit D [Brachybacterium]RRR18491.1 exonuclease sbcCD subunit D [Brachybacterium paraconglomeratum]GLI30137.1 nuclease SbcCD subunit D [Brachybacterium conglomeratum]GLK04675.1 nuclease SbcCD subunit D [Brachybacterium conglomeratum]
MKILHTSDWHLGRTLHKVDLHEHQAAFLDWLVDLVEAEGVDVVVIPGDVYDRAVPAVSSVTLLDRALARLADTGATVVLTSGNHDSPERLGFGRSLMRAGIHLLTDLPAIEHPVSVEDEHGEVLFFGLPYLEPDRARTELAREGEEPLPRSHEAVTRAALDRVRERAAARPGARTVVLAHTFVTGGEASDSERDLSVGGVDSVPAGVLGGIDYLALGHLHGCQDLTRSVGAPAWYSGSPLAFSFSERSHRKSVLLVELGAPGADGERAEVDVRRIETPVPRRLTELRGTLEEILARRDEHAGDWLKAVVTDPARPAHLQEQLREAYPHLLLTEYAPEGRAASAGTPVVRREQNPLEVMDEFLAHVTGGDPTAAEHDVLERAYSAVRRQQEAS